MARGVAHNPDTKAAVMAALLSGQGVDDVAASYSLPESTIKGWKRELEANGRIVQPEKTAELGDLILEYVRQNLTTLTVQAEHFRDRAWLQKQPADQLAVLHGVVADKTIRILEAIAPDDSERPADPTL